MPFPFIEENRTSRERLEALALRLSEEDLQRSTPAGWTVAALLAPLAVWDRRVLALLRRWKEQGMDFSPIDADAVNEALKPLCLALPPRTAIELCRASAAAVDAEIETLSSDFVAQFHEYLAANPFQFRLTRSLHRNAHLDEIDRLL